MESGDYYIYSRNPVMEWGGCSGHLLTTRGSSIYPAPPTAIKNLFRYSAGGVSRSGRPSLSCLTDYPLLFPKS